MNLNELMPQLLEGLGVSVLMWVSVMAFGFPLGLFLSLAQSSRSKVASALVFLFVELGRGAPVLVLLYLFYFGLPSVKIVVQPIPAAIIAFSLSAAAYSSEIFRGAFSSIPSGQHAAARVLGFSPAQRLLFILLPQALRIALPAIILFSIIIFQGTALAYAISVPELLGKAYNEASMSFRFLEVLSIAGLIYLGFSLLGTWAASRIEAALNRSTPTSSPPLAKRVKI